MKAKNKFKPAKHYWVVKDIKTGLYGKVLHRKKIHAAFDLSHYRCCGDSEYRIAKIKITEVK